MERIKTRIWRGGMAEMLADSEPPAPALEVTRILNAQEMAELRAIHTPSNEDSADELALRLLPQQPGRRIAVAVGVVLLAFGGWFATRADAAVKPKPVVAAPAVVQAVIARPVPEPAPVPVAPPVLAPTTTRPREAVDALAAGDDAQAARLYRQLASRAPAFERAAQILETRNVKRRY